MARRIKPDSSLRDSRATAPSRVRLTCSMLLSVRNGLPRRAAPGIAAGHPVPRTPPDRRQTSGSRRLPAGGRKSPAHSSAPGIRTRNKRLSFLARRICSAFETIMYQAKMEKKMRKKMMQRAARVARPQTNCNCVSAKKQTGTFIQILSPRHQAAASLRANVEE